MKDLLDEAIKSERQRKLDKDKTRSIKIKKAISYLKKASTIAREGLEIYSSVKSKNYFSVALGALSATGVVLENTFGTEINPDVILADIGAKPCYNMDRFVRNLLKRLDIPANCMWNGRNGQYENSSEKIEEYRLGNGRAFFVLGNGDYVESFYLLNEKDFYEELSLIIEEKLGKFLSLEYSLNDDYDKNTSIFSIAISNDIYINNNHIDEAEILLSVKKFFEKGLNRSLLFYGLPGTGKSTCAIRLTKALKGKILILDGSSLSERNMNLLKIINIVDPVVVLFDDLDRITNVSQLLGDIEKLNKYSSGQRHRLIIATVNDINKIPKALRRPGRFDQAIEFRAPDAETRLKVLCEYSKQFNVNVSEEQFKPLVSITEGMTQAYLKEVVLRCSALGIEKMAEQIEQMKNVMGDNVKNSEANGQNGEDEEEGNTGLTIWEA